MENREEKKTGKLGRFMGWLISVLLIASLAWGFVMMYPRITQEARELYEKRENYQMQQRLGEYVQSVYPLMDGMYVQLYRSIYTDDKTEGEIILGDLPQDTNLTIHTKTWYENRAKTITAWYANSYKNELSSSGIEGVIRCDKTGGQFSTLSSPDVLEAEAEYPFLIRIKFNHKGIPQVEQVRGLENAERFIREVDEARKAVNHYTANYAKKIEIDLGIRSDVTVTLACSAKVYEELKQDISVERWVVEDALAELPINYIIFLCVAVAVIILLGLLIPTIRPLGLQEGWKAHIPLELLVVAAGAVAILIVEELPKLVINCQMELEHPGMVFYWLGIMQEIMADGRAAGFIFGANIAVWFAVFFLFYLCVINLRQLFAKGPVRFLKENTLTGRILCLFFGWGRNAVKFCGTIDFSNKGNRNFFLAVLLNFIVIALLCCTWFFGILLAIPYSLFVFWLLQKWWNKIRTDYVVLLSTTEEMASGITDVEYVAKAGIFHELNAALAGVQEGFHTAVKEEVKSQKMKTELITNVSHDLKTPLTAIITYVDLLKEESLSREERRNYVDILDRKSIRLKTLIEDLFEISKATSGELKLDKVDLDLVQLIQEVQLELEEEIMNSGITFKMNLPEEKAMVHLDAQKTGRIFENLTLNILKHGLTGSRAYISVEPEEKIVHVIYKNVSAAEINYNAEEILERFTRGDASRNTEGSGLGLAIVKSFAEAQGGEVKVELEDDLFKISVSFPRIQMMRPSVQNEVVVEVTEEVTEEITEEVFEEVTVEVTEAAATTE